MSAKAVGHTQPDPDTIVVTIEHAPADSFSRQVDPSGMRYARAQSKKPGAWPAGNWARTGGTYAETSVTRRGREVCISTNTFERQG